MADFTSSAVLFSIFILSFGVIWNSATEEFTQDYEIRSEKVEYTLNLLETEGNPQNWTQKTVRFPGLYSGNFLDENKFIRLKSLSDTRKRELLKSNNYKLELKYMNQSQVKYNGKSLSTSSSEIPEFQSVFVEKSITVLKNQKRRAILTYYLW
ncbi:hypothetical protein GLU64_03345 [Nanohaloarchaea archaeon]|nr:hypothetical protein [Candidatus Nanohaloarchaea archaeon]